MITLKLGGMNTTGVQLLMATGWLEATDEEGGMKALPFMSGNG